MAEKDIAARKSRRVPGTLSRTAWAVLIALPLLCSLAALCIGRMQITPAAVFRSVLANMTGGSVTASVETVLWKIRLPRILLALLVGGGLSAAGCAFQSLFANPLATPDTLGVASGASFGAALGLLAGVSLIGIQVSALFFGLLAVLLTWAAGTGRRRGMHSVVLAGIMIGSLFSALISFVKFTADSDTKLPAITYFLMGSLDGVGYRSLALGAPLILIGTGILFLLRWRLNLLPLSEDEITASGVNVRRLRIVTVLCAAAVTASCVSMCGQVGWIGLLVPHACRLKFGGNHLALLPASVLTGSAFMVIVDTAARSLTAAELPVSILTAVIGAPFFIYLMRRSEGMEL